MNITTRLSALLLSLGIGLTPAAVGAATTSAPTNSTSTATATNGMADITGTLEVVQVCYTKDNRSERLYNVTDEKTGQKYKLNFGVTPAGGHLTGERVRVRGDFKGADIHLPAKPSTTTSSLEVLTAAPEPTTGISVQPKVLYAGGANPNTVIHKTLVELLVYSDYKTDYYTGSDTTWWSNQVFATTGNSVNTDYLEDTYGAIGFAGDVVICHIAAASGDYNVGTWISQGDAAASAQGYTPGNYLHKLYVTSGSGGWAGLATVGYGWAMVYYSDGGTITHELGHNLGFLHSATEWGNTGAWSEYGDSSDFMGGSYDWRHNNGPHKIQQGWVAAQLVTHAGTYQISRIEDVPSTVPYPQVIKIPSSSAYGGLADGWPYYFSYKQNIGFDANSPWTYGLEIHRWGGSQTALISVLSDGQSFTDSQIGLTVKQIRHDATNVTVAISTCVGTAQPYTIAMTGAQLAARTTMLADVALSCDLMVITNFDAASAKGGAVTLANNQLFYTPPGSFSGNDAFNFTLVNSSGQLSSSTVTVYNLSPNPSYSWDVNGAGAGGTGNWDAATPNWNNGTDVWPASGAANWALFGGTSGTVSIASGGVRVNGLDFSADGYVIQNGTVTLNGTAPAVLVEPYAANATISSVVAGTGGLTKQGQGTLTLSGANTYTGGTMISQGTLLQTITSSAGTGMITLGDTNTGANNVGWQANTGGNIANSITVANQGSGSATIGTYGGGYTTMTGPVMLNRSVAINDTTGDRTTFTGVISGNPGIITITGTRVTFDNAGNNFAGNLVINSRSVYQNNSMTALPTRTSVTNNGTFQINNGGLNVIDGLTGSGGVNIIFGGPATLSLGNNNGSGFASGPIVNNTATLSVIKNGIGTQTFSGANSYSGTTTVAAGKLVLSSAQTGAGAITVRDGATLGVTVSGTSQLAPSSLTEGSSSGPTTNEFTGVSSTTVAPVSTGTLTLKGTTRVNILSGGFIPGQAYPLIAYTTLTGAGSFALGTLPSGVVGTVTNAGNTITLSVTAAPLVVWNGTVNGTWDINYTPNWKAGAAAANYPDGIQAQFDDSAAGTTMVNSAVPVSPSRVLVNNTNKAYTIGGSGITGPGSLIKSGPGTLTLTGGNSYMGGTIVNGGTLVVAGPNSPSGTIGSGNVTINTGVINVSDDNSFVGYTTSSSRLVTIHAGGTLANPGSSSCHLNALVLDGGTLSATTANSSFGNWTLDYGVSTPGNGLTSVITGGNISLSQSGGTVFNIPGGDALILSSVLAHTSSGLDTPLIKQGAGTMICMSANSYSGTTTVAAGKLVLSSAQTGTGAVSVSDGATLGVTVSGGNQLSTAMLTEGSSGPVTNEFTGVSSTTVAPVKASTLTVNGTTTLSVLSGTLSAGNTYPLLAYTNVSGAGTCVVGTLPYGVTGVVTNTGTSFALKVTAAASLPPLVWNGNINGAWDLAGTANWTTNGGGAMFLNGAPVRFDDTATGTTAVSNTATVLPSSLTVSNMTKAYTLGGSPIAGSTSLIKGGTNTLTLTGANSFMGGTTINAGTLTIGGAGQLGVGNYASAITNNGAFNYNSSAAQTLSGVISGSGALNQSGQGTLTLSALNTYTGVTTINGGIINPTMGADYTISHVGSSVVINTNGSLRLGVNYATGFAYSLAGNKVAANVTVNAGGTFSQNGYSTYVENLTLAGSGQVTGVGEYVTNGVHLCANVTATSDATGVPVISLIQLVGGAYTDSGNTHTFAVNHGAGSNSTADLTVGGIAEITQAGGTSLIKTGAGTMVLSGANTYTGTTTVSNGMLLVNGALAAGGAVTVKTGATLGGTGAISGATTIQSGGTLAPGNNAIGTLTFSNSLSLSGQILIEISMTGSTLTNDLLTVKGSLTRGGTLTVTNVGVTPLAAGDSFTLFNAASATGSFSTTTLPPLAPGLTWTNRLSVNGSIQVIQSVNTTSTNITVLMIGGTNLTLSWPADHTGWRLLTQTNRLSAGVSGSTNDWGTLAGSSATNLVNLPITPATPAGFYRLVFP